MVLFWELKFFDLMVRHHAGVVSENNKRGWNFANSHKCSTNDWGMLNKRKVIKHKTGNYSIKNMLKKKCSQIINLP